MIHPLHQTYFSNYSVLRTSDLEEARTRVSQKFCDHRLDLADRTARLSVAHNAVRGTHLSVNYLSYGAEVMVDPGYLGAFYLFQIPLSGKALIRHRGDEITAHARAGTLLNPDRPTRLHWDAECSQLLFQIDRTHLETVASALTGAPLPGPVRFDMSVDFSTSNGQKIHRSFMACAKAVERGVLFQRPLSSLDAQVEFDLVQTLLTQQNSNISHIITRADTAARPRDIRRALDYMHAKLGEPITITDIAQAADVNIRTLQKSFRQTLGLTPMQVLRNARLDTAHYLLMARCNTPSVSDTAYSTGFSHLGRFSSYYRGRFGHRPSEGPQP
ncbi:AraC family transcriptional regulator [Sulfitobacter sp.]|uniref:AraC family transcriptional regulator n=1 Tax=Sulfitobacter sp. TaxID=1903071 RepID=UPI0030011459